MRFIKNELTWGDVGVMASIVAGIIGMTLFVADGRAQAVAARADIVKIETEQRLQNERMDKLSDAIVIGLRNQAIIIKIFEERTGKPLILP